ncbi:hypothetical protein HBP99_04270 [Listeria booriae]|uniref:hypothetical protein n=1 Tax=Listeria booriae TaxID=1552123 RepID=UPI001624898B|nr:hypothetical protein [Listeria booriae]MBC2367835.1 hypothetical protein [Listeria booriae]
MAKLNTLINTKINQDTVSIQGVDIPVIFTMESMEYIQEAYGEDYALFEAKLNAMMTRDVVHATGDNLKIIRSLIYAMVRSGGTECTLQELTNAIPFKDISGVYDTVFKIFQSQNFQEEDLNKIVNTKK